MNSVIYDAAPALDAAAVQLPDANYRREHGARECARVVLLAFLDRMSADYCGDMYTEQACGYLAQMVRDA